LIQDTHSDSGRRARTNTLSFHMEYLKDETLLD